MPMTVPSSPSSGPRLPMTLRYSIRRNWSAVCSPIEVSIASFIAAKLGARFSAGFSALLTKLGSVSVKSISSLNWRFAIRSRMWFVLASGNMTTARALMKPCTISVRPTIDRSRIVIDTKSGCLRRIPKLSSVPTSGFAGAFGSAAAAPPLPWAKPVPVKARTLAISSDASTMMRNVLERRMEPFNLSPPRWAETLWGARAPRVRGCRSRSLCDPVPAGSRSPRGASGERCGSESCLCHPLVRTRGADPQSLLSLQYC